MDRRTVDRRTFTNRENMVLGRFLAEDEVEPKPKVIGWSRKYRCDCGFCCTSPGLIYDHAYEHKMKGGAE